MKTQKAAVGVVEFCTIAAGFSGTDHALKNNNIVLLYANTICPGGYLLMFVGGYAAVSGAVSAIKSKYFAAVREAMVIGSLSDGILERSAVADEKVEALGVIETMDTVSAVYAADEAVKTAGVCVEGIRLAHGIGGKGLVLVSGGIAEVSASVARASGLCRATNSLIADEVITNPHEATRKALLGTENNIWR